MQLLGQKHTGGFTLLHSHINTKYNRGLCTDVQFIYIYIYICYDLSIHYLVYVQHIDSVVFVILMYSFLSLHASLVIMFINVS